MIREFTAQWCDKDDRLGALSLFGTFAFYFATFALAVAVADRALLLAPLVVINALAGVRLYVLQHDCGHHSLFARRGWNDLAGHLLSTFTLTPYRAMQANHNTHHAHVGDLDHRRAGEIHTMTLREWQAASGWERLKYRIYRHPLFLIPVGGIFTYAFRYRWPKNARASGVRGVMAHNIALAGWILLIWALAGPVGLWIYGATVVVAAMVGVFLVYLQHNFEDTYWDRKPRHRLRDAVIQGSSALDLGWWFDLATANIAYHDLHHDNPRIPHYRLRACHRAARDRFDLPVIGWREAFRSFTLKLWDEDQGRLVPFPKATAVPARQAA